MYGVIIDREERYALRSAEVYMCLGHDVFLYTPITYENMQIYSNLLLLKELFTSLRFSLVDKLSDQFNAG